ncbi:TPA: hypothetical protein PR538_002465 [Staphylococcus aureus]|nr:hypothetical protein [Staphylococcus aureus]
MKKEKSAKVGNIEDVYQRKKRIRNKIQKQREIEKMRKFYMDEFHLTGVNKK